MSIFIYIYIVSDKRQHYVSRSIEHNFATSTRKQHNAILLVVPIMSFVITLIIGALEIAWQHTATSKYSKVCLLTAVAAWHQYERKSRQIVTRGHSGQKTVHSTGNYAAAT